MVELQKIEDVARELGIPKASLRSAAEKHGFLVRMGRQVRIDRNQIQELVNKCRVKPEAPASTNSNTARSGTSATPDTQTGQRALLAVKKLKKSSQPTSQQKGGKILRLKPE